jgi:hypothetical protein
MRFQYKSTILVAILWAFSVGLKAQTGPTDKIDIIKNYEAQLLDANKMKVTPTLPALDTTTKYQDYVVPPRPAKVSYDAPKLRPLGMKSAGKETQYKGFAKVGGGIPASIYGEAGYGFGVKDKFDGKVWARHHQANFKDLENQRFRNTEGQVSGSGKISKSAAVEGKVGYSYDRVHFYGYDHKAFQYDEARTRQDFKILDIGARVFNGERTDADFNYFVAPKFYSMRDNEANKETGFDLLLGVSKWFADKHVLRVNLRTDFTSFGITDKQKLNNIYIQPSFTFHTDYLRFKVGGNFASNRDVFHVFPDAELNVRVFGDGIQLFVAANGDLRKNTYRSISDYNPFIDIRGSDVNAPTTLKNTDFRNYFGGIRGNFSWVNYSIQGGYSTANDLALYQTFFNNESITRFEVLYDSAKIYNLQGTITLKPIDNLTVGGTLSQNIYKMNKALAAWGLPGLEGNFNAEYKVLEGKVGIRAECYIADKIRRRDIDNVPGKDGALVDFGLGGNYYFTKNIGAFLDINNILNNKRERWHTYPTYGLNVLVGLTAKF